jgi:hypothetical protein
MLCEELYKERCRIKHPDLNFVHDDKWRQGKNNALKQAVKVLIEAERVMIDNGNPDNHGEKRYLQKVLLKGAGALKKTGAEGPVTYFECEGDPDKISEDFPVLKELCLKIGELNPGAHFPVGSFIEEAKSPPYGTGGTALVLALSHVVRAFGERLRVYKDSTKTIEQSLNTYDDLIDVVRDFSTKIVFEVRDISAPQAKLVEGIASSVNAPGLKYGETRSLSSVSDILKEWWQELPPVVKIMDVYEENLQKRLKRLKEVMDVADEMDRFDLLLESLPSVYAEEPVDDKIQEEEALRICEEFASDVKLLESGLHIVRTSVAEAISELFDSKGDMVLCETVVTKWYEGLNPNQRDPHKCDNNDAQALLMRLAESSVTFQKKFLELLPQDYGFDPVSEWSAIRTDDYAARVRQAKTVIDEAKHDVPIPEIKPGAYVIEEGGRLEVGIAEGAAEIIYTTTGEDPKKTEGAKRIKGKFDLAEELGDQPSVPISMRSIDPDGNVSDLIKVELVNKAKEYEIQIDKDLFGEKGSFKFPEDAKGLITVIKSLLQHGIKRGFVDKEKGVKIYSFIKELLNKKN